MENTTNASGAANQPTKKGRRQGDTFRLPEQCNLCGKENVLCSNVADEWNRHGMLLRSITIALPATMNIFRQEAQQIIL